ncbi:MAG: DUF4105 domain-containing protein [Rhodothermaceae bacterium]|nr:DUF4105 domain-containing protein [Rhodothermaceae bacterium]
MKIIKYLTGILLIIILLVAGWAYLILNPSNERDWRTEHRVLPTVEIEDSLVHIRNVRNFRYPAYGEPAPGYYDATYDLGKIESVWFVLSPFLAEWRGPAHSFLSFEFADSQFVSISVETRREKDSDYSFVKGALNQFELMYVIGDERDLIGLRVVTWEDPVYLYPMRATPAQVRELFVTMLTRAQQLEYEPEFYNTITNNCTTNIVDAVNVIATERIPYSLGIFLPGYSDNLAHRLGFINSDLPLEEAREQYRVDENSAANLDAADFSHRIRNQAAFALLHLTP